MMTRFLNLKWFLICVVIVAGFVSFLYGANHVLGKQQPRGDGDGARLYELRIYHALPGKLPVMEQRFREKTSKILAKHELDVVGYWESTDKSSSEDLFVFLLAHKNRDEAHKNWQSVIADPEFHEIEKAEQSEKTLEKAEVIYLRATEFSQLK